MKVTITGASAFVNRMFEACGPFQWARELLKNAIEAQATRVEFGIEWQAVEHHGVYRRTVIDNGTGMDARELLNFFSTLGAGAKKIGGIHDNFGVGAKIASLPWNPDGVVVVSYMHGKPSMIRIMLDPESGDYELMEFEVDGERKTVIDPTQVDWSGTPGEVDWGSLRPDWVKDDGTIITLLGSEDHRDTVLGVPNTSEADIKGLSVYLNSRFWDLGEVEVKVVELRSDKKTNWPRGASEQDDARRPNNRTIQGAKYYLTDVKADKSSLAAQGKVPLEDGRVVAEYFLWTGERPYVHSYAKRLGYIAIRYKGELYELTSHKAHFRWFGVTESKVQQNLFIILDPQHYSPSDGRWGVHPDQSRNRLIFTGNGERGFPLPIADWGQEFSENMPDEIREAILATRAEFAGELEDDEYRKRLQERFGSRWTMTVLVKSARKQKKPLAVTSTGEEVEVPPESGIGDDAAGGGGAGGGGRRRKRTLMVLRKKAAEGGTEVGEKREVPVDVPRYIFAGKEDFSKPWHLAMWVPNDPEGPTVRINIEAPVLSEAIEFHKTHYADHLADEVRQTVQKVFGEVAVAKIAHSQKLRGHISEEELDRDYRSEAALTIALMGLLAEESLIAQRLGKLGRKKAS